MLLPSPCVASGGNSRLSTRFRVPLPYKFAKLNKDTTCAYNSRKIFVSHVRK
jgi:hypothetical protein